MLNSNFWRSPAFHRDFPSAPDGRCLCFDVGWQVGPLLVNVGSVSEHRVSPLRGALIRTRLNLTSGGPTLVNQVRPTPSNAWVIV